MEEIVRRYPIGVLNSEDLRNTYYVYVDKTDLVYKLVHSK